MNNFLRLYMDFLEKRYQNDNSFFFLIIFCILICSAFSSFLINDNAKILKYIGDNFYKTAESNANTAINIAEENNKIQYSETRNGEINEIFIRGKLQECIDNLLDKNKVSETEIKSLLNSINNSYEIGNILNLNTEINLLNQNNQNSFQDIKIKLDNFRYLEINNIGNQFIINKIFNSEGIKEQLNNNIDLSEDSSQDLHAINNKNKINEILKNFTISVKEIKIDKNNVEIFRGIPVKSLIGYSKSKSIKLTTLKDKQNKIIYFNIKNGSKSLSYYLNNDGRYYSKNGNGTSSRALFSSPLSVKHRISSTFGMRVHPILRYRRMHTGVDLAASYGSPVKSSAGGKIEFIGHKGGYGRYIIVNHGNGYKTGYGHLSAFSRNLRNGSFVTKGQVIGKIGTSGIASGPHLHYEIIQNKKFVNPLTINAKVQDKIDRKEYRKFSKKTKEIDFIVGHSISQYNAKQKVA